MRYYDAVILGSGVSGLTSAILLAQKGKKVAVLEQYSKPGGYMHSFRRFNETFDTGAHYLGSLGDGQPFRVLLEYLGVYQQELFSRLDHNAFDVLYFPEGKVNIPQGYAQVISELTSIFPKEKDAIGKYFSLIKSISNCFPTYRYNDTPAVSFPREALDVSLKSVVEALTQDPRLQSVFYAYCNLHGVQPGDVAFGFHAIVTDSLLDGAYGIVGGGDALTESFVARLRQLGVEIFTKTRVTQLKVSRDRKIESVVTETGDEFRGDWIISSLHPKVTFNLLSTQDHFPPVFKERLKNMKESSGIFGIYAVCNKPPVATPKQNHYFFASSDPAAMFRATNPNEAPPVIFMSSPKRTWVTEDRGFPISLHAPASYEWFAPFAQELFGKRSEGYKKLKAVVCQSMWNGVARYQPEILARVQNSISSSPLTNLHFNGGEEGTSYGIYHSMQNTGAKALGPRTKILNLLLTGQNCLFPGLLGAATSALRSTGHIIGIKPILRELKARRGGAL